MQLYWQIKRLSFVGPHTEYVTVVLSIAGVTGGLGDASLYAIQLSNSGK